MAPTLPTILVTNVNFTLTATQTTPPTKTTKQKNQKTNYAAPAFCGNSGREGKHHMRSPTNHTESSTTNCNGLPTEDRQRRQQNAVIQKYNAKLGKHKEYPELTAVSEDQYKTTT